MIEDYDPPAEFETGSEPGVAKFAELICGEDFQDEIFMMMNDEHHWEDDDMSLRDRLNCAQANYMILTGLDEPSYPALPEYTPWMMETVSGDEVGECRAGECRAECRAGDMVIAGCGCWESGDDFWQFHEDEGKF